MDTEPQVFELKPDEPDVSLRFSLTVASGTATLTIDSDPPGASIWVDGEFTRKYTPATVDVEAGSREIVLRRNGYKDFHDEIQVREGAIESIARSLEIL